MRFCLRKKVQALERKPATGKTQIHGRKKIKIKKDLEEEQNPQDPRIRGGPKKFEKSSPNINGSRQTVTHKRKSCQRRQKTSPEVHQERLVWSFGGCTRAKKKSVHR